MKLRTANDLSAIEYQEILEYVANLEGMRRGTALVARLANVSEEAVWSLEAEHLAPLLESANNGFQIKPYDKPTFEFKGETYQIAPQFDNWQGKHYALWNTLIESEMFKKDGPLDKYGNHTKIDDPFAITINLFNAILFIAQDISNEPQPFSIDEIYKARKRGDLAFVMEYDQLERVRQMPANVVFGVVAFFLPLANASLKSSLLSFILQENPTLKTAFQLGIMSRLATTQVSLDSALA